MLFRSVPLVVSLVTGILGLKHHNNPAKAGVLLIWGLINLVLKGVRFFATITTGSNPISIVSMLLTLAVAAIYVLGANRNKQIR